MEAVSAHAPDPSNEAAFNVAVSMARSGVCGKEHGDQCVFIDWRRPEY
jgi:hypothetical protein